MLHEMDVSGLALDPSSNTPILILKAREGELTLPIWIGLLEAASIAMAMQNTEFSRPMTHDLFKSFLDAVNARVDRVEICDLRDNTYFAQIYFNAGDSIFSLDARPSDAIAMALRTKSPIFADDEVIKRSTSQTGGEEGVPADESEEGKKWAEYLAGLDPDEFGKYKM